MAVTCSSHNLCQLEDITTELKKDSFALAALSEYEIHPAELDDSFSAWNNLMFDRIQLTQQHIHDLVTWEKCLREGHDLNGDPVDE